MLIIYTLIGGFKVFDIVFSVTAGGPAYATELMATYLYKQVFQLNNVGYGSAIAIFLALLVMVVSIISIRLREELTSEIKTIKNKKDNFFLTKIHNHIGICYDKFDSFGLGVVFCL